MDVASKYIGLFEELHELHGKDLFKYIHIDNGYDFQEMCKISGYKNHKINDLINSYE